MLMTASEVAVHLKKCTRTIYRMKDRGDIPYYQIGRNVMFKLEEIEEATKCQKRQNGAP